MWIPRSVSSSHFFPALLTLCLVPFQVSAQPAAPSGRLISRQAIVADSVSHKVYAVDPEGDALWVFDSPADAPKKLGVGKGPVAVDVNASTGKVYVLNHESGTVSVVDEKTDTVTATVDVGARPYVLAVDPGTNKVFVSNIFSDMVTIIDGASNATSKQKLGSADAMASNAKTGKLYLLGYESSSLTVLNGADGSTRKAPAGAMHLWGMAVDASRDRVYVTRIGSNDLAVISDESTLLKVVATGALPSAVAVDPMANRVYVANYGEDSVTVIDGETLTAIATVKTGKQPQAVAVDPVSGFIYVANTHGDTVTVIDGRKNAVVATLPAGKNPYALALSQQALYVADQTGQAFTRIATTQFHKPSK